MIEAESFLIRQEVLSKISHINFVLASMEANYHRFTCDFYNSLYKNTQECLRDSKVILRSLEKQPQEEIKQKYKDYSLKHKNLFEAVFV